MQYFYNYVADAVVREDETRTRYIKYLDDLLETSVNIDCKEAWGIPSYGILNALTPITQEQYETFGIDWEEIEPKKSKYQILHETQRPQNEQ